MNSFSRPLGLGSRLLIPQIGVAQAHYCHTVMGGFMNLQVSKRRDLCAICPEQTLEARIDHSEECDLWVIFIFSLFFLFSHSGVRSSNPWGLLWRDRLWESRFQKCDAVLRHDPVLYNNITVI